MWLAVSHVHSLDSSRPAYLTAASDVDKRQPHDLLQITILLVLDGRPALLHVDEVALIALEWRYQIVSISPVFEPILISSYHVLKAILIHRRPDWEGISN